MKRTLLILLLTALVTALLFAGCAGGAKAPAEKEIRLGHSGSLTGMYAGFGTGGLFGLEAAIEDVNKEGGIYVKDLGAKLPVKLITANNESDAVKVGTLAEDLIVRNNVHLLISGIIPPPMNSPVATVAERHKVPFVTGTGPMEPWMGLRNEVTPRWSYTWTTGFRIATPAPSGDFRAVPGYTILDISLSMLDRFGKDTNKVAGVFASNDPDGVGWYQLFPEGLKKEGYQVIGVDKKLGLFPMETTDFSSVIQEWKNNKVEIFWGNCPAPPFATMWRQAYTLGFRPKMVYAARAGLFYIDAASWGGNLPWGVACESWWDPSYKDSPGFGRTTPQSLNDRWVEKSKSPVNPNVGWGYMAIQVTKDVIERAGTLNGEAIIKALAKTDLMTMVHRVKYDENQFSAQPLFFFQWAKINTPQKWEPIIVVSQHAFIPTTGQPIWPMPYE